MDYNRTYESSCNFYTFFGILLDAHTVQYGINFNSRIEIHLTYTK
jgi:hypothetical protein